MANEGLQGIRLTDIHGYDNDNYHEFYNNNISAIGELSKKTGLKESEIGASKYINHLIDEKMGSDWYNQNAKGKTFSEKVGMYNALFDQPKLYTPLDNNERLMSLGMSARQDGKTDLVYNRKDVDNETKNVWRQMYRNGDLVPSSLDDGVRFYGYRDWFAEKANESANYSDRRANLDRSINVLEGIYDDEYFKGFEREEDKISPVGIRKANEYKAKILDTINNNPKLAYNMFLEFENNALIKLDDYNNYQNTAGMPYTPNEMKDIMAEFYAKGVVQGDEAASNWLYKTLHDKVWKNKTLGQKLQATIQGLGANTAGGLIAAIGMFGNVVPTIAGKIRQSITGEGNYTPVEGVSGWSSWWYNVGNNPLTKWGNDMITTGAWNTAIQEERKKTNYNPNQLFREAGEENQILNPMTILDIAQQGGFTIGASASSTLISGVLRNVLGKHVSNLGRRIAMSEASRFSQIAGKSINALGKGIVLIPTGYMVAGGEAMMDSSNEHDAVMRDKEKYLSDLILDYDGSGGMPLVDYIIQSDPLGFEGYYNKHRTVFPVDASNIEGENQKEVSDEQIGLINAAQQRERQFLYEEYRRIKIKELLDDPRVQELLRTSADRRAAKILMAETNRIAFGDMFLSNILGGSFKESKRALQRALTGKSFGSPNVRLTRDAATNMLHAEAKNVSKAWTATKATSDVLNEGFEELSQGVWSALHRNLGDSYVAQYIANLGDERALEALSDNIFENWDATQRILKEQLLSKENWYAFALGAASAGIGNPTVVRGAMNSYNRRSSGLINTNNTFKDYLKDIVTNYWRNPYVEAFDERKRQEAINAQEAEDINHWLENHKDVAEMTDAQQFYAWFVKAADAAADADVSESSDVDYRDALMGQRIAGILMMDRFGVNDLGGRGFRQQLKVMSELEFSDPEAKSIIEKARATQNNNDTTGKTDEEIFNQVKRRAAEVYAISDKIRNARNFLNTEFGEAISENTKDAWAFEMVMQDDLAERETSIIENLRKIYNKAYKGVDAATSASEVENAFAKYGGKDAVVSVIAGLRNELQKLKDQKRIDKANGTHVGFRYRAAKRRLKGLIKEAEKAKKLIDSQTEDVLITEDKILGLDITSMASLLSDDMQKYLSPQQRREVEKFKNTKGFTSQMMRDVNDANLIHQRRKEFETQFNEVMANQSNMIYYDRGVRMDAARNLVKHRLDKAVRANTYDVFEDELNKFMDSKHSVYEDMAVDDVLKNNRFYADWKKLERKRKLDKDTMGKTNAYKNLDAKSKRLIDVVYDRALRDKDTSLTHIKQLLEDEDFRSLIGERFGIESERTISDEVLSDVLEQINNYNSNAEAIRQYEETLRQSNQQRADADAQVNNVNVATTMSPTEYTDNVGFYNEFFSKTISDYILGAKAHPGVSVEQLIAFANLYSETRIGTTIFDEKNVFMTFSVDGIREFAKKALEETNSMRSGTLTSGEQVNVANTEILANALIKLVSGVNDKSFADFLRAELTTMGKNLKEDGKILVSTFEKRQSKPVKFKGFTRYKVNFKQKDSYTGEESKWAEDNKIWDNLNEVANAVAEGKVKSKDLEFIFIADPKLANITGRTDSDYKPIIMAVRVEDSWGLKGNTYEINGNKYMYVGLLRDSRLHSTFEENEYNALRRSTELSDDNVVLVNGKIYTAKGFTIEKNGANVESVGIVDYVRKKVGNTGGNISEERNVEYALITGNDVRLVYITNTYDEKTGKVRREYKGFDGNTVTEYYDGEKDKFYPPQVGIIDRKGNLAIGYINNLSETKLVIDGKAVDVLAAIQDESVDWYSESFMKSHHPITKALYNIRDTVFGKKSSVLSVIIPGKNSKEKGPNEINNLLADIGNGLTALINNRNLNFGKTKKNPESNINFTFRISTDKSVITFSAMSGPVSDGNVIESVDINTSDILDASKGDKDALGRVEKLLQKPLMSSILNDSKDGLRLTADPNAIGADKNKIYPMAKPQVDYGNLTDYGNDSIQRDAIEGVVRNGLMSFKEVPRGGEVSTYATVRDEKKPEPLSVSQDDINSAMEALAKADMSKERGKPGPDGTIYTGVTTAISDEDISNNSGDAMLANMASSFGTAIDKAFRVFLEIQNKLGESKIDDAIEETLKWFNENTKTSDPNSTGWHGLPGVDENNTRLLLRQFHERVVKPITERGETIVAGEFYFRDTLTRPGSNGREERINLSMVPDLITIDRSGRYHIYDFKTFHKLDNNKGVELYSSRGEKIQLDGLSSQKAAKWQKQLSLYKYVIEGVTGRDVASLEIIPISLTYRTDVTEAPTSSGYSFDNIGNGVRLYNYKDKTGKQRALKLSFSEDAQDRKTASFINPLFINFKPIPLKDIPSSAWEVVNNPTGLGLRQNVEERSVQNKPAQPVSQPVEDKNETPVIEKPIDGTMDSDLLREQSLCQTKPGTSVKTDDSIVKPTPPKPKGGKSSGKGKKPARTVSIDSNQSLD